MSDVYTKHVNKRIKELRQRMIEHRLSGSKKRKH
jgi:hypothetical protein